jgi:hypothetical protein
MLQLLLLLVVCAVPPRILQDASVWVQHFKLFALLLLFALTLTPRERAVRMNAVAALLLLIFAGVQITKIVLARNQPQLNYFSKTISQHYITDYTIANDTLFATAYSMKGKEQIKLALEKGEACEVQLRKQPEYIGAGNLLYKNIVCRNDSVIFLCDAGRGVGLYHIYSMPRKQFPFNQLK